MRESVQLQDFSFSLDSSYSNQQYSQKYINTQSTARGPRRESGRAGIPPTLTLCQARTQSRLFPEWNAAIYRTFEVAGDFSCANQLAGTLNPCWSGSSMCLRSSSSPSSCDAAVVGYGQKIKVVKVVRRSSTCDRRQQRSWRYVWFVLCIACLPRSPLVGHIARRQNM